MKALFLVVLVTLSVAASAQECTPDWEAFLDTDPLHSKVVSGDSNAAYALYSFWGDPNLTLEIRGKFPKARFMSFETEHTRFPVSEDHLFDYEINPDRGSENPFQDGVSLETSERDFTIVATPDKKAGDANTIRLTGGQLINALMFRIYRPNDGVTITQKDLPRIFARDLRTGKPIACPRKAPRPVTWHFPQFLADIYTATHEFEFSNPGQKKILGMNSAAAYSFALADMDKEDIVAVRFRAPTYFNPSEESVFDSHASQVRYWSFCTNNFPNNQTLNCVPDKSVPVHSDGFAYIAIGATSVKTFAQEKGYAFLPDVRGVRQKAMAFVYRNLVPTEEFKKTNMYQGDYLPEGKVCPAQNFLMGTCGW